MHFRIHTQDWKQYDIINDYSHVVSDGFVVNPKIRVKYMGFDVE